MKSMLLVQILFLLLCLPCSAKEQKVKEYTRKDGTVVKAHTRTVKDKDTVKVKGYTKADGTKVAGYERKKKSAK